MLPLVVLAELGIPERLAAVPARPEFVDGVLVALVGDQRVLGEEAASALVAGEEKVALGT